MKIQLVNPHTNYDSRYLLREPHLGLVSIASHIRQKMPDVGIEFLDSSLTLGEDLQDRIGVDTGIVGISCSLTNYSPLLFERARERGARVFLGGPYASVRARQILGNQPTVEGVVIGEGERAFFEILQGKPLEKVVNLAFRQRERVVFPGKTYSAPIGKLPEINWDLVDLGAYAEINDGSVRLPLYSMKGCSWREKTGGCSFCSIPDPKTKIKSPERYWREVQEAVNYGAVHIRDAADDLPSKKWLRDVLKARPESLRKSPTFFRYVSARHIDRDVAKLLSDLNHTEVYIGYESGDDALLRKAGKGVTAKRNIEATKLLADEGVGVFGCWIVGLQGEDTDSLKRTIECAERIKEQGNILAYGATIMIPYPGSRVFGVLNHFHPEYELKDEFNIPTLQKDWIREFGEVDYYTLFKYRNKILNLTPRQFHMI